MAEESARSTRSRTSAYKFNGSDVSPELHVFAIRVQHIRRRAAGGFLCELWGRRARAVGGRLLPACAVRISLTFLGGDENARIRFRAQGLWRHSCHEKWAWLLAGSADERAPHTQASLFSHRDNPRHRPEAENKHREATQPVFWSRQPKFAEMTREVQCTELQTESQ